MTFANAIMTMTKMPTAITKFFGDSKLKNSYVKRRKSRLRMASDLDINSMKGSTDAIPTTSKKPNSNMAKSKKVSFALSRLFSMSNIFLISINFNLIICVLLRLKNFYQAYTQTLVLLDLVEYDSTNSRAYSVHELS